MTNSRCLLLATALVLLAPANLVGQTGLDLDTNCIVSILNRSARVKADGTWRIDNVPANMGLVRVRATCVKNGITLSGQSDFINLEPNIENGFSPFALGSATPIPSTLTITAPGPTLNAVGATAQLTVTATYPDNSTKNVSAAAEGTSYTISSPATAAISPNGLVTAKASGTVVISALNDGALGMIQLRVVLTGDADCCLATRAAAQSFQLDFVPLQGERYDFVMRRKTLETPAAQAFVDVLQRASLRRKLEVLAGYDTTQTGAVLA